MDPQTFYMKLKHSFERTEQRGGLECGTSGAKLVILTHPESGLCVENVFIEEKPFESRIKGESRPPVESTRQILIQRNLSGYKIVFVAEEAAGSCFAITPKMSKADADGAILLQAKKLLSWESSEPIMAHMDSEFLRDRTGSVVGLADWKTLKPWCRLVEGSGGVVDDITVRACAYLALAGHQGWAGAHPVFLIADLGASSSCFYVLDRYTVRFMREAPVGGDAITKALTTEVSTDAGTIHLSEDKAEELKISGGVSQGKEHMEMMVRPVIERISSEIMRSIQFFKENTGQKVEAVFITGGSSRLQALMRYFKQSIPLPVETIDPFAGLNFSNTGVKSRAEKHKARLAVAVGLALAEEPPISLLPRFLQTSKRLAKFAHMAVIVLLVLGFFPLLFAVIFQGIKIKTVRPKIERYKEELVHTRKQQEQIGILQMKVQESSDYYQALNSLVVRDPLWPGILNALADAVHQDVVLTRFSTGFNKDGNRNIILEGRVLPSAAGFDNAVASLLQALNSSVFFSHVSIAGAEVNRTEEMLGTFEIECGLVY